jgi:hypothetical protein
MYFIALNPQKKTVGCVLIQRIMGGNVPTEKLSMIDWDTSLEGMRLYQITEAQLNRITKGRDECV